MIMIWSGKIDDDILFLNNFEVIALGNNEILLYLYRLISDNCFDEEINNFSRDTEDQILVEIDKIKEFFLSVYSFSL